MLKFIILGTILLNLGLSLHKSYQTVAIICTTDIHGYAFPYQTYRLDTKQKFLAGGLQYMASMVQTLKQEYKGSVLYLDAGDQFQGGVESSDKVSSGQIMNDYFNEVAVDASALGNHDFDFSPHFLLNYMEERKDPSIFLAANLRSENNQADFLPKQYSSKLYRLQNGLKIGVIGIIIDETKTEMNKLFPDYHFLQYAPIIQAEGEALRSEGADSIVLVSHLGDKCEFNQTFGIWSQSNNSNGNCSGDITDLLNALPQGTVDAVVQGHTHVFAHHFVNGVPIAGVRNGGFYFNVIYLKFHNKQIYERTIEGPIPVCQKIFEDVGTCDYLTRQQAAKAGELVNWKFHDKIVQSHSGLKKRFQQKWIPLMTPYLQFIANNELYLTFNYLRQSQLNNFFIDLLAKHARARGERLDFAILNPGVFRGTWLPGAILQKHFITMFAFEHNEVVVFDMVGQELIDLLKYVQTSEFYYPTYNLQVTITEDEHLDKQYVSGTFMNGQSIDPKRVYRGLGRADHFVSKRGRIGRFKNGTFNVNNMNNLGQFNTIAREELRKVGKIPAQGLIDPNNPRFIVIPKK